MYTHFTFDRLQSLLENLPYVKYLEIGNMSFALTNQAIDTSLSKFEFSLFVNTPYIDQDRIKELQQKQLQVEVKTYHTKSQTSYPLDVRDLSSFKRKINLKMIPRFTLASEMKFRQVSIQNKENLLVVLCRRMNL